MSESGYIEGEAMDRRLAFRLLISQAVVDAGFFERLSRDPRAAAKELHVWLADEDVDYLTNTVDWKTLESHAAAIRNAVLPRALNASW